MIVALLFGALAALIGPTLAFGPDPNPLWGVPFGVLGMWLGAALVDLMARR